MKNRLISGGILLESACFCLNAVGKIVPWNYDMVFFAGADFKKLGLFSE